MDSLISAAARALAVGDAVGALKRVALREDPPALALRGIAMAQLGEHPRARELLRRAARGFGTREELARARCVVAEAEVALAMRDLGGSLRALTAAADALEARGDHTNAMQAQLIVTRRYLLVGRLDEASAALTRIDARDLPPLLATVAELTVAELELRSLRIGAAQSALARAHEAAELARVPALKAEVAAARAALEHPAARRVFADGEQVLRLEEVAALQNSGALVIDACRRGLRFGAAWRPLARRPILFALARMLAEAWPGDADREALIACAFRTRHSNE
ncbi:MAG TPA: helix-turn-helix domain-containing protein, partial [Casimicrobiaceae bacterium]|nr:helix-turn-helix domain-containing protein [Casimicrobiaceae bacterium]